MSLNFKNSQILNRWLETITRKGTKAVYKTAFKRYAEYTKMAPEQLIDEAVEDQRKDPREKQDVVKQRLIGFYHWLVNEAPKMRQGSDRQVGKGLSSKLAHTYVNAIRSFYATFGVYVKLTGRSKLPAPRVTNHRKILSNLDVRRLLDHCRSPRDRAIILTMFQSGMDVSTLCSLRYGDVAEGLAKGEHPLKLNLYRPKTGVEYYSFLGRDACESIRAYLNDLKARGIQLSYDDPLFLKEGPKALRKEAVEPHHIQALMRQLAVKVGFKTDGRAINPVSPHALRESFSTIMVNHGVPKVIVDFWLGHKISELDKTYMRPQEEELRKLYLEREEFISVTSASDQLEQKIEEKTKQLQEVISNVIAENVKLKEQLKDLEQRIQRFEQFTRRFMNATSEELEEIAEEVFKRKRKRLEDILAEELEVKKQEETFSTPTPD